MNNKNVQKMLAAITAVTGAGAAVIAVRKKRKAASKKAQADASVNEEEQPNSENVKNKEITEKKTTAEKYAGTDMPTNVAPADPKYRDKIKRALDVAICTPTFIVAIIPMILVGIAVKLDSPGPILFRQKRLGLHGQEFEMLKFRSMCVGAEHTGSGVYSGAGDARVTRVGKIIRATSLDELPQLINILRGDMSLIGPRPPLTYHPWPIDEYTDEQRRMFDVRPGVTGWAQTHGRKDVEWHHRIELNVWYVDHVSLALDLRIFLSTIFKVLRNEDNQNIEATLKKDNAANENA